MANKVLLKRSSVPGKVPTTADLDYGELSVNYADGTLYYKTSSNTIGVLNGGSSYGNTQVAAYLPTSSTITTLDANLGTATTNITTLFSNAGSQATSINSINANIGAYEIYANANIGTIKNNLSALDANVGSYEIYANANIGTIKTNFSTLDANLGTATTNITTLFSNAATQAVSLRTLDANLGTATTNITTLFSNAAIQQTQIDSLVTNANANTAAYLPSYTGSTSITAVGSLTGLTVIGNTAINNTLYGRGVYDNSNRVISTSTGAGNLTISGTAINLTAAGPGAASVGSSTAIPVITTDAYGRVSATSTAAVVAPAGTLTGSTLASGVTASSLTSLGTLTTVTAGEITISGNSITSTNAVISIDPSTVGVGGTVVIAGNLQVTGTTTTVNSTTVEVTDLNLTLAKDAINDAAANGAGITVKGANDKTITYASTGDTWAMNKPLNITGGLTTSANSAINSTLYAQGVYDNSNRVLSTSTGAGNLTISGTAINLTAVGPGAASVGSSTAVPVITTDAYGRVASTTTAAVVAPAGTLSGTTLNSGVTASSLTSVGTLTGLTVSGSITPNANVTVNLGSSTAYYGTTYSGQFTGNGATIGAGGITSTGNVAVNTATNAGLTTSATTGFVFSENVTSGHLFKAATTISIGAVGTDTLTYNATAGSLIPGANAAVNLGSSTAYWGTTYTGQVTANAVVISAGTANAAVYTGNVNVAGWIMPFSSNATYNLGSSTRWWGTVYGKSVQAQYADLAENYAADADYEPGTVVVFGGSAEVTVTNKSHDTRVAGVVSTNPAYLMNATNSGLPIAMTGRVPCKVRGPVEKGTVLTTSNIKGVAEAINNTIYQPGSVLGKALGVIQDNSIQTIEVVVGRF